MIGMMNAGVDTVEFYSPRQPSSLYRLPPPKPSITYTRDGRALHAGEHSSSADLWHQLLLRSLAFAAIREAKKGETGALAALRRLSKRLRLSATRAPSTTRMEMPKESRRTQLSPPRVPSDSRRSSIPDRPPAHRITSLPPDCSPPLYPKHSFV